MLKCSIHELPRNIVIDNFYARLSGYYKDYLYACLDGSFTRKDVNTKWDVLEAIQNNIEDWDSDKGKGSGINYEYDCIKAFIETADFQELSAKYGLDPQIMVDCLKTFASHINVPKGNGDVYHEPFKYTCIESDLLLMITINMLKLLKALLLISMLIFVEYIDHVNKVTTKMIIVSTTGMKKPECGSRL
jgi:hypothetical protein